MIFPFENITRNFPSAKKFAVKNLRKLKEKKFNVEAS